MIKKISLVLVIILSIVANGCLYSIKAQTLERVKIVLVSDKTECFPGDTVKVTIQGQNVVNMFGLQFTLSYDPGLLEMQGSDIDFQGDYMVFGGKTVDKSKGILTYPLINQSVSTDKKTAETIGYVSFKALKKGSAVLTLNNIKAVDNNSNIINDNTQFQMTVNIIEKASPTPTPIPTTTPAPAAGTNVPGNNTSLSGSDASGKDNSANTVIKTEGTENQVKNVQTSQQITTPNQSVIGTEDSGNGSKTQMQNGKEENIDPKENNSVDKNNNEITEGKNTEKILDQGYVLKKGTLAMLFLLIALFVGSVFYGILNRKFLRIAIVDMYSGLKDWTRENKQ